RGRPRPLESTTPRRPCEPRMARPGAPTTPPACHHAGGTATTPRWSWPFAIHWAETLQSYRSSRREKGRDTQTVASGPTSLLPTDSRSGANEGDDHEGQDPALRRRRTGTRRLVARRGEDRVHQLLRQLLRRLRCERERHRQQRLTPEFSTLLGHCPRLL